MAERVHVLRQVEVVVDRLRHVHDAQPTTEELRDARGAPACVVTADRDEHSDAETLEGLGASSHELGIGRWIRPRDSEERSSTEMDPAGLRDRERLDVRSVPL